MEQPLYGVKNDDQSAIHACRPRDSRCTGKSEWLEGVVLVDSIFEL